MSPAPALGVTPDPGATCPGHDPGVTSRILGVTPDPDVTPPLHWAGALGVTPHPGVTSRILGVTLHPGATPTTLGRTPPHTNVTPSCPGRDPSPVPLPLPNA